MNASVTYKAEERALSSLARSEQCRAQLAAKLFRRGFAKGAVSAALDFLEGEGALDDARYATAWLRARAQNHAEGRVRLAHELAARGVARGVAEAALDDYFREVSEGDLCRLALAKEKAKGTDRDRIIRRLMQKGFGARCIREVMREDAPQAEP